VTIFDMLYLQTQKDIPVTASRSSSSEIRKSLFSMGASAASTILLIKLYHTVQTYTSQTAQLYHSPA